MPVPDNTSPRYSLQPPCGLPAPFRLPLRQLEDNGANQVGDIGSVRRSTATDNDGSGDTLMSCFGTLTIPSLPLKDESAEVVGSAHDNHTGVQTKCYPGPKLSDRATQGPDAGPLIDRFSCLFQDRELHVVIAGVFGRLYSAADGTATCRVRLQVQPERYRFFGCGRELFDATTMHGGPCEFPLLNPSSHQSPTVV